MAAKEILIISSSPAAAYNMSSSPPLPSPSEVFKRKIPILRTGSRTNPIPQNATASLTSASSLLKLDNLQSVDTIPSFASTVEEDTFLDTHNEAQPAKPKSRKFAADKKEGLGEAQVARKPRKAPAKKDDASIGGAEVKRPRKPRIKKSGEELGEDRAIAIKEKASRKPRAKKADGRAVVGDIRQEKAVRKPKTKNADCDAQTKLPKKQITKASTSKDENGVPPEFMKDAITKTDPFVNHEDYGLVEAVKRRINWTPPPYAAETVSLTTPVPIGLLDGGLTCGGSRESEERSKGFQDLLRDFGFSKLDGKTCDKPLPDGAGTRKRKLVELVKTNVPTSNKTPVLKTKAHKKKPRTITAQATSAYTEADGESGTPAPLLQYFSFETTNRIRSDGFKIPPKPRSKSPVKVGKGTAKAPILLSPGSTLKGLGNQDFVFGTSSQLAREESPTFLRDIHAAMQASNEIDDYDPFTSSPAPLRSKNDALSPLKRNLWSAAARDGSGQLLDVEMVDLVNSPAVKRQFHTAVGHNDNPPESHQEENEPWHDIEELVEARDEASFVEKSPKPPGPVEAAIRFELLSSPSSSTKSSKSPTKSSTQSKLVPPESATLPASKATKPGKAKTLEKPEFAAYTMAQLVKEVASYHFKPVKGRDQMIALLEKCWEGKQRMALGTLATNLPISSPEKGGKPANERPPSSQFQAASPKRPRGRPRKDNAFNPSPKRRTKTASMANALSRARKVRKKAEAADEISDSDTAPTPSPPRRHPSQIGTPPLPLQLSSSASVDSRELSPASSQVRLFKYITTAVKNAPLSTDSTNPSWHEKILLYDPIVLEDLTVWLNAGALEKARWDGEVDPKEVKKWCESKSICCLWKENLRGGTRSRY